MKSGGTKAVGTFGKDFSLAVNDVADKIYSGYWDMTDALDHVAFFEPGYVDLYEGRKHSEDEGDTLISPVGNVAVWKSAPTEIRMGENVYGGCTVVLVLKGEKPSVSERNHVMLRIRSSSAMAAVKVLAAVKELADEAEKDLAKTEKERSERAVL